MSVKEVADIEPGCILTVSDQLMNKNSQNNYNSTAFLWTVYPRHKYQKLE